MLVCDGLAPTCSVVGVLQVPDVTLRRRVLQREGKLTRGVVRPRVALPYAGPVAVYHVSKLVRGFVNGMLVAVAAACRYRGRRRR